MPGVEAEVEAARMQRGTDREFRPWHATPSKTRDAILHTGWGKNLLARWTKDSPANGPSATVCRGLPVSRVGVFRRFIDDWAA